MRSPGVTSASSLPSRERDSVAIGGPIVASVSAWSLIACDDLRVRVADRDVDELRGEVEVALAVVVPEVAALGALDRDRVDRVLHAPRVEDVVLRVLDDLPPELGVRLVVAIGSILQPVDVEPELSVALEAEPGRGSAPTSALPERRAAASRARTACSQRAWTSAR